MQFKIFDQNRDQVISNAKKAGVKKIIAVGTNLETSLAAVEISANYPEVFAAVGIHPHHVFGIMNQEVKIMEELEKLLSSPKVIAVGETGMDKHLYKITKYPNYLISKQFLNLQKIFFASQIKLAIKHKKSLIIHNRQAILETLQILEENWDPFLKGRSVFHFCEPDKKLLDFAKKNRVYIGVDADVITDQKKQKFVKLIPLDLLVLETDSPFISKTPSGLKQISEFISNLLKIKNEDLKKITYQNGLLLFKL